MRHRSKLGLAVALEVAVAEVWWDRDYITVTVAFEVMMAALAAYSANLKVAHGIRPGPLARPRRASPSLRERHATLASQKGPRPLLKAGRPKAPGSY